jgi:putative endonuclease
MWFVYILYSNKIDRYYTGSTDDLEWRLERHNSGWGRYTKKKVPWKLVYNEEYSTKGKEKLRKRKVENILKS